MFVIWVAALLLARAESGGLVAGARPKPLPFGTGTLAADERQRLARELAAWGRERDVAVVAELLVRAGLLAPDEANRLRPTPAAYDWLHVPHGNALRMLLTTSTLTFDTPLSPTDARVLAVCDLLEPSEDGVSATTRTLLDMLHDPNPTARKLWNAAFAPYDAPSGWLYPPTDGNCLTFTAAQTWQLFRLLAVCTPCRGATGDMGLAFAPHLFATARARGFSPSRSLRSALADDLPPHLVDRYSTLMHAPPLFRVRQVTLLEAVDRAAMQQVVADRALRPYVSDMLSARHAVIADAEVLGLQAMFARRGLSLSVPPRSTLRQRLPLILTRPQMQTLVGALQVYRRLQVDDGDDGVALDELLTTLMQPLTRRERREADALAAAYVSAPTETSIVEAAASVTVRQQIEQALAAEADMTIVYGVPGRATEQRRISPMQMYEEKEHLYLVAYCHLRRAQRTFRVDRLRVV